MNKKIKEFLDIYSEVQPVNVIYRPNERVAWNRNKKLWDGKLDYEYNHRDILDSEVVFDFDDEDINVNVESSYLVLEKLDEFNIPYTVWSTGSKGIHIHTFWNLKGVTDVRLMKRCILKFFAGEFKIDYQLSGKHNIRMEYGVNEKNRIHYKEPLHICEGWFIKHSIPKEVFEFYTAEMNKFLERKIETPTALDDDVIKDFLDGKFQVRDGREKFMFFLINNLKYKLPREELIDRICSWYFYSEGNKLTRQQIINKVDYHLRSNITYSFGMKFFNSLLKDYNVTRKE